MKQLNSLKNLVLILSLCAVFTSCSKKDVAMPIQAINAQSVPISYTDENISINNFKAAQISQIGLQVSFSVTYADNVSKIEVLSGASENQLCAFYSLPLSANDNTSRNFSINDTKY